MRKMDKCHSEEALWTQFKEGDAHAYECMFKKFYNLLYNYGLGITRSKEETKDCIQQLFAGLWESRQRLGSCVSIRSYLVASLRRLILRRIADRHRYVDIEFLNCEFHVEPSAEMNYIKSQAEAEQVRLLWEAIGKLPERQREALHLKYFSEYSFEEIAQVMGIHTRGVYKLIYKALNHLSNQLADRKLEPFYHIFNRRDPR